MRKIVPHPILTLFITFVWLLLANDVSAGHIVLGLALGILIPLLTSAYWPDRPRIRAPLAIVEYGLVVLWDIIVSNVMVARLVLFRRGDSLKSTFVTVPLDITSPEAITALAGTITMTPGTVSCDLSADGRALLVHCLNSDDPAADVAQIKTRYEARLKRIFG
ncbi:Na+/H+ antiporter subunit E [Chelatococcus composti]|jgi:multicomponent K+:H+ antiporter subunit E|uniref:Multicomponent K+:H+ antiporter subunit E n=1 Tax=Chelatococcus composti TaxID=1743235 RepID=A0A841K4J0_9HYPH|nr:Na+/H+ antiporter subunit E [Chelatococcus composti]MBB6167437.1 multicomponent K+:H+ antiporter subunit E [Chelatococcus composti]MBS7735642.1 Na+/H+ antiporter subunit E [Chelatococcus composti]PZN43433.1 MAG: Na+/H+ antiporter subunit E [Pseudomonadota bacterium]GGG31917.1 Na+/H+ antiporter subunit E [Chelatococcus composti]